MVLERIAKANLTLKPSKCQWLRDSVKFLGHIVSKEGVAVDPAKVRSVSSFPIPLNKSDVRGFLGMTSYYQRFIPDFASRSKHLAELTKKKCLFRWTEDAEKAFEDLKSCLTTTPILRYLVLFANKVSSSYLEYKKNNIKVSLTVQAQSSSVAVAIDFLRDGLGEDRFISSESTVQFIKQTDRLFDILKSRNPATKEFKQPLR
eukprot:gene3876-4419_t